MSSGKVKEPQFPDQMRRLSQVERSDGNIYLFNNIPGLAEDTPVIFNIQAYEMLVQGRPVVFPIAVLDLDSAGNPEISKGKWSEKFKNQWKTEWSKTQNFFVEGLKVRGSSINKNELLNIQSIDNLKEKESNMKSE